MRKRTEAYAAAVKMTQHPLYRVLRGRRYGCGIKEAMEAAKELDAILLAIKITQPVTKQTCEVEVPAPHPQPPVYWRERW